MIDDEELFAADLIGRRLLQVTTAWHHYADDDPSPVHLLGRRIQRRPDRPHRLLAAAGLRLAPDAKVHTTPPIDPKA